MLICRFSLETQGLLSDYITYGTLNLSTYEKDWCRSLDCELIGWNRRGVTKLFEPDVPQMAGDR